MEKSVETGKPQLIDGIPQRDMEAMRKRLYVMAVGKNYSLRTGFTENGSGLIVQASPKGEGAAVEVVEEKVEEIVVVPTPRPRRTTRKATTATKK